MLYDKPIKKWSQRELADRFGLLKQFEKELEGIKDEMKSRYDSGSATIFKGFNFTCTPSEGNRQDLDQELLKAKLGDLSPYMKPRNYFTKINCSAVKRAEDKAAQCQNIYSHSCTTSYFHGYCYSWEVKYGLGLTKRSLMERRRQYDLCGLTSLLHPILLPLLQCLPRLCQRSNNKKKLGLSTLARLSWNGGLVGIGCISKNIRIEMPHGEGHFQGREAGPKASVSWSFLPTWHARRWLGHTMDELEQASYEYMV